MNRIIEDNFLRTANSFYEAEQIFINNPNQVSINVYENGGFLCQITRDRDRFFIGGLWGKVEVTE